MREELTFYRYANAILLERETFIGTFLLVEGDLDKTFYKRFVVSECELKNYSGKSNVIEVLNILEKENFPGVLAIVDADFDYLDSSSYNSPNLIRTDTHDLETMLLNSFALDKVINELGSQEKITSFGRDIRTVLIESGRVVGYLRWVSQLDGLNLTFNDIKFSKFIDENTMKIDELKLIQEVKNKSQKLALKSEDLQQRITNQKSSNHDPWQVCCGHDLVEILSIGLRKAIGTKDANDVKPENLERNLRLAYEETYFCKTQIYFSVRTWESNNRPFRVLRNEI